MSSAHLTVEERNEAFRRRMADFLPNRAAFPLDELDKYRDQYVAFDPEGTRIVAATADLAAIFRLIAAAGYDPETCPVEFVP